MRTRKLLLFTTVFALLLPTTASRLQGQDGFLFGHPAVQLTLRAGPMLHRAEGDLFDFFRSELTLDRGDFRAPSVVAEFSAFVHPRVAISGGVGFSLVDTRSEFREWVDQDDQPIEQTTQLIVVPVTLSGRIYLLERGHSISRLAWIPARTNPYIGGGAGVAWYRLRQQGDFVSPDQVVFVDDFRSQDSAFTAHGLAGVDHWLTPRIGLSLEGRYALSAVQPVGDFTRWDRIDLSGLQVGVGLSYRW